jgi:hypothetical protein
MIQNIRPESQYFTETRSKLEALKNLQKPDYYKQGFDKLKFSQIFTTDFT